MRQPKHAAQAAVQHSAVTAKQRFTDQRMSVFAMFLAEKKKNENVLHSKDKNELFF